MDDVLTHIREVDIPRHFDITDRELAAIRFHSETAADATHMAFRLVFSKRKGS